MALNKKELKQLDSLYSLYYREDSYSVRDLKMMYELEKRGSRQQIIKLLKNYGANYDEEFD